MKLNELQALTGTNFPTTRQKQEQIFEQMRLAGLEPGSIYQELEMDNRYVNIHRDTSFSNDAVQLHSHSFYELLYCSNTCGAEYLVGSRRYRLQKGDILFVSPGVSHRPILPEVMTEPYVRVALWLSEEFIRLVSQIFPISRDAIPSTHLLRTSATRWEFLSELFYKGVSEAEEKNSGWELAVIGNALQIIVYLNRALTDQNTALQKAETPSLLDQVMAYIEENLSGRITLEEISRHCFASESTISHLFQQKLGVSVYRCVTQRRLIASKELIEQGLPLKEIYNRVGYEDYSTFYRAFKQEYGIGPSKYRRRQSV